MSESYKLIRETNLTSSEVLILAMLYRLNNNSYMIKISENSLGESVAVIGLGYVGLPVALLASSKGYHVLGIDNDEKKLRSIRNKKSPFLDSEIDKQLAKSSLTVSNDYNAVKKAKVIVICVPTPVDDSNLPDISILLNVCSEVAKVLQQDQLIILESTVNPGVSEEILIPMLEKLTSKYCGEDFYFAHCPERINPGDASWNVSNIPRVLGGFDETSLQLAHKFYSSLIDAPIKDMANIKEAEAVKIVENSFRDVNIAFVNELAMSFDTLGIDVVNVIDGAATKPFAFMAHYPGAGVGGHCIPVDPYYLIEYASKNGYTHEFLKIARDINNSMPNYAVKLLLNKLKDLGISISDAKVTVLGLSYKPNVGDMRESPSLKIIEILNKLQIEVSTYDPYIFDIESKLKFKPNASIKSALSNADAVIIATAHDEFVNYSNNYKDHSKIKVIIDGRNCIDKAIFNKNGIIYKGIGR